jgi:peroxiredoxin
MTVSPNETIGQTYNYKTFTRSESAGKSTEFKNSLRAGENAPDFELPSVDGDKSSLASFRGRKHVLLEFGSIT